METKYFLDERHKENEIFCWKLEKYTRIPIPIECRRTSRRLCF